VYFAEDDLSSFAAAGYLGGGFCARYSGNGGVGGFAKVVRHFSMVPYAFICLPMHLYY